MNLMLERQELQLDVVRQRNRRRVTRRLQPLDRNDPGVVQARDDRGLCWFIYPLPGLLKLFGDAREIYVEAQKAERGGLTIMRVISVAEVALPVLRALTLMHAAISIVTILDEQFLAVAASDTDDVMETWGELQFRLNTDRKACGLIETVSVSQRKPCGYLMVFLRIPASA